MSDTVTRGIRIIVEPRFIAEQSNPDAGHWLFAYHVTIRNEGSETVQLISRHWVITDGEGHVEEVRGPGVVGYQPVLAAGEEFQYTSGCPLGTPVGTMHGEFNMVLSDSQQRFDAHIKPFRLAVPTVLN
ncbi:Co2+/Mg2+ efflux protein ApaG [Solimonas marina]|uniref:Protein ApaG n=1 Tax=Solimonas marina TaxID=2714601 RepID=A0A969W5U7_9GAMM|nr:Co2+/Mg2+ efflux protein ApaG [Solimonas marina]NKF21206.1 Co2+/Mg2+ efflux protein ApaG [Solimonas marina]